MENYHKENYFFAKFARAICVSHGGIQHVVTEYMSLSQRLHATESTRGPNTEMC